MSQKIINGGLISQLIDKLEDSDKKEQLKKYIMDTVVTCEKLCVTGLNVRVLIQFQIMLENLAKELDV